MTGRKRAASPRNEKRIGGKLKVQCVVRDTGIDPKAVLDAQLGRFRLDGGSTWHDVIFVRVPRYDGRGANWIPYARAWFKSVPVKAEPATRAARSSPRRAKRRRETKRK